MKSKIKEILRESNSSTKSIEIQAPNKLQSKINYTSIFLAGSIEMGKAIEWQKQIVDSVPNMPYIFFNPRRDDWDSSWAQKKSDKNFNEQVTWELKALEEADYIVMFFDPKTESPISLLELGLHARGGKLIVICPEGFWKKGNVDVTSEFYNIKQIDSIDAFIDLLKNDDLGK